MNPTGQDPKGVDGDNALEHIAFLVDDDPFEFYGYLRRENRRFLKGIDHLYWIYQAEVHEPHLTDAKDRQRAAAALRLAYGQGIEMLFALLGATLQSPKFPLGWMMAYRNHHLRSVVAKIQNEEPIRKFLRLPGTWEGLSECVHQYVRAEMRTPDCDIVQEFAKLWRNLAHAFLDENFEPEYNNVKHGMRAHIGGFSFKMKSPEAGPDDWTTIGESDFGATFRKASKVERTKHSYDIVHVTRAWLPQQFVGCLKLIAMSVQNIASRLLVASDARSSDVQFSVPVDRELFSAPWREWSPVSQMTMPEGIKPETVSERSADAIRRNYDVGKP
jgi:hypothetical protein